MMSDVEIYEQLKSWYAIQTYHGLNCIEHKKHGQVAHDMLLFYKKSFSFWKKQLSVELKYNSLKGIKECADEMQNKILAMESYKSICNELDRTR